ncbi:MAG: SHOCT domain-containing protein [Candidatus Sericytochromatia bacterium]|nr:SHOCT domain-containing protein [Candidatus Sericytochromatia bacterium]
MMYDNYNYGGMHLIWWFVWIIMMVWIFAIPYNIPGQRISKASALDILQIRFASGNITDEEYQKMKKTLENDLSK